MAKVLGFKQFSQKVYLFLEGIPEEIARSFGKLTYNFILIVWGQSGHGKSNFLMQFIKALMPHGKVLYVSLEEGFEVSMQMNILRHLNEAEHGGKIEFADHEMTIEHLEEKLSKKKSPRFIVIDSVQYWDINFKDYKRLKEKFKRKTFLFVSHAAGKLPEGSTADDIRYDAAIKVRVEGYVAFVTSRLGGNKPYVIWEEGAKKYWGKNYKRVIESMVEKEAKIASQKPKKTSTSEAVTEPQLKVV
jgi:hypothetical protein